MLGSLQQSDQTRLETVKLAPHHMQHKTHPLQLLNQEFNQPLHLSQLQSQQIPVKENKSLVKYPLPQEDSY